jgi:hypothetical protein
VEDVAYWTARLSSDRFGAVERLRALEEQAARDLLGVTSELVRGTRERVRRGIEPATAVAAAAHLAKAERWQWEIGTWSTGSGEGLQSMAEVRALQMAQAWLLSVGDPARVAGLLDQVQGDPNGMGEVYAADVRVLRK